MRLTRLQLQRFMLDPVWIVLSKKLSKEVLEAFDGIESVKSEERVQVLDETVGYRRALRGVLDFPSLKLSELGVDEDETTEEQGDETPPDIFSEGEQENAGPE